MVEVVHTSCELKRLRQENKRLKQAEKALNVFFRAVSHDLRNPVVGTILTLESIMKREHHEYTIERSVLEAILEGSKRQQRLINSIIEAREIGIKETSSIGLCGLHKEPVAFVSLIESVISQWKYRLVKHGARVVWRLGEEEKGLKVDVDSDKLCRVVENFLSNTLSYNSCGGLTITITVTLKPLQGLVICEVADDGVGIPVGQQEQIFDLYVRGSNTKGKSGLGLGLYICKQIVEAHGGEIGIREQSKGACFWFSLPCVSDSELLPLGRL